MGRMVPGSIPDQHGRRRVGGGWWMLKEIVPVLAALTGGLLTALGSSLLQRASRSADRRRLLCEKLEEMYVLTARLERWATEQGDSAAMFALAMTRWCC